jgi:hypothetical protein
VLDQLAARDATCQSTLNYIRTHLPYAPAQTNGPSAASVIADPTLSGTDFAAAAAALAPRLESLVAALEQGAGATTGFDIQGGCGVGSVHVEAPELYGLAVVLELIVASIQAMQGYDWGLPATIVFDPSGQEQAFANALNAHLFHLVDAASLQTALPTTLHAFTLLQKGVAAAQAIPSRPPNSLFDWPALPSQVLADVQTFAVGFQQVLTMAGPQPLPFFDPALMMNGLSFFDSPVDLTGVTPPIWSAVAGPDSSGDGGYELESSSDGAQPQLVQRFSPNPFAAGASGYSFTMFSGWQNISSDTWTMTFDPDNRWQGVYGCSN